MTEERNCIGILLAGGLARRMGGADKALREAGGLPLLAHAAAALRPQCLGLVLSANGDPARFAQFRLPAVADNVPGFKGPLAGILAGLDWIAAHVPDAALALSVPADMPFLPGDLAVRLIHARREQSATLACASSGGRIHHPVALWPVAIREDLRDALVVRDVRKVQSFAQSFSRAIVEWPAGPCDPFFNVNDANDLALAQMILSGRESHIAQASSFCHIKSKYSK
jgi:molybdopterin-guanine dinucleotide biosynthesis protein A